MLFIRFYNAFLFSRSEKVGKEERKPFQSKRTKQIFLFMLLSLIKSLNFVLFLIKWFLLASLRKAGVQVAASGVTSIINIDKLSKRWKNMIKFKTDNMSSYINLSFIAFYKVFTLSNFNFWTWNLSTRCDR